MQRTAEERFRAKFQVDEATGCWVWTASRFPAGYGQFRWSTAKNGYAHIWAYERYIGPVPKGMELDHLCRRRECCNPLHVEPVTHRENIMRAPNAEAAINARKEHCKMGHAFTLANTYLSSQGKRRHCRTCARLRRREWVAANPELAREVARRHEKKRRGTRRKAKSPASSG